MAMADPGFWSRPPQPGDLEPFVLGEGRVGVLLVHGFCGTPPEVRGLGEHLARRGFRVHGALLAGHGTSPEDLERHGWEAWMESAQDQLDALRRECDRVMVAGQSMGGTVSLLLAARNPEVAAVATLAALVRLPYQTRALIRVGRWLRRWHFPDQSGADLWEPQGVDLLRSYSRRSMRSHVELLRLCQATLQALPRIRVPTLVVHGGRDRTVPAANAGLIASRVGGPVEVRRFERSGHGMTVDVDREAIFALVAERFLAVAGEGPPAPGPGPVATDPKLEAARA
jgi:carboxylesterase